MSHSSSKMVVIRQEFTNFQQELSFFASSFDGMLTHSNFLKLHFHIYLKRILDYYMSFDRELHGLQNDTKF